MLRLLIHRLEYLMADLIYYLECSTQQYQLCHTNYLKLLVQCSLKL